MLESKMFVAAGALISFSACSPQPAKVTTETMPSTNSQHASGPSSDGKFEPDEREAQPAEDKAAAIDPADSKTGKVRTQQAESTANREVKPSPIQFPAEVDPPRPEVGNETPE